MQLWVGQRQRGGLLSDWVEAKTGREKVQLGRLGVHYLRLWTTVVADHVVIVIDIGAVLNKLLLPRIIRMVLLMRLLIMLLLLGLLISTVVILLLLLLLLLLMVVMVVILKHIFILLIKTVVQRLAAGQQA